MATACTLGYFAKERIGITFSSVPGS